MYFPIQFGTIILTKNINHFYEFLQFKNKKLIDFFTNPCLADLAPTHPMNFQVWHIIMSQVEMDHFP